MAAADIDLNKKREELIQLYQDVFDLISSQVQKAKAGEITLRASMLKEINQSLKLSSELLDRLRAEQEAEKALRDSLSMTSSGPDGDADGGWELPFPVPDEPLKY